MESLYKLTKYAIRNNKMYIFDDVNTTNITYLYNLIKYEYVNKKYSQKGAGKKKKLPINRDDSVKTIYKKKNLMIIRYLIQNTTEFFLQRENI